jgi:hypothetical protein
MSDDATLKLADFGFAKLDRGDLVTPVFTPYVNFKLLLLWERLWERLTIHHPAMVVGSHTSVLQLPLVSVLFWFLFLFARPSFDVSEHVCCISYPSTPPTPVNLALRLTTHFNR